MSDKYRNRFIQSERWVSCSIVEMYWGSMEKLLIEEEEEEKEEKKKKKCKRSNYSALAQVKTISKVNEQYKLKNYRRVCMAVVFCVCVLTYCSGNINKMSSQTSNRLKSNLQMFWIRFHIRFQRTHL